MNASDGIKWLQAQIAVYGDFEIQTIRRKGALPGPLVRCVQCGQNFEQRRKWQKFCSQPCQLAAWRVTRATLAEQGQPPASDVQLADITAGNTIVTDAIASAREDAEIASKQ